MSMEIEHMTGLNELLAGRHVAKLEDGMTIEQWTEHGRSLFAAEKQISWAIADWWAFGDQRYGERASIVAEGIFGKRSFGSLRNAGSTARAFPETSRQHDVPFSHHQEAAPLARSNSVAAAALLETAAEDRLTKAEVREASKAIRNPEPRPTTPPDHDSLLSSFLHHWNRLPRDVRLVAAEMIEAANGEVIDPA